MNKREDWWEYTKRIIRSYPALCRKAESVGDIPCTPAYGASGGHSGGGFSGGGFSGGGGSFGGGGAGRGF